jgi:hypothetical protein
VVHAPGDIEIGARDRNRESSDWREEHPEECCEDINKLKLSFSD